jgi:hypothetical protein
MKIKIYKEFIYFEILKIFIFLNKKSHLTK